MANSGLWALDSGVPTLDSGLWSLLLTGSEQNQNSVSDFDQIMQNYLSGNLKVLMITLILQKVKVRRYFQKFYINVKSDVTKVCELHCKQLFHTVQKQSSTAIHLWKISPENLRVRDLLLVKLQTDCSEYRSYTKITPPRLFSWKSSKIFWRPKYYRL